MSSIDKPTQSKKLVGGEHLESDYYEKYDSFFDLEMMVSRMQNIELPEEFSSHIRQQKKNTFLVLGSATTKNINGIAKIAHYLHGKKSTSNDLVAIVDINDTSVALHEKAIRELDEVNDWGKKTLRESSGDIFPYPQYRIEKADIRTLPHDDDSIDIAISDYTINYLDTEEDVRAFFSEVHRVLKDMGIMYIALKYTKAGKSREVMNQGGVEICTFAIDEYKRMAQESGLRIIASDRTGGGDSLMVFGKSVAEPTR